MNVTSEQGRTETVRGSEGGVRLSEEGSAAGRQDTGGSKDGETESQQESVGGGEEGGCELVRRRAVLGGWEGVTGAGYFDEQWRTRLCRCASCKVGGALEGITKFHISPLTLTHTHTHQELYATTHTHFLLDEDDTVAAYEARAQTRPTILDAGMAALSSQFDRVHQVEAFHRKQAHPCGRLAFHSTLPPLSPEFNELKSELVEFLQDFEKEKKVSHCVVMATKISI